MAIDEHSQGEVIELFPSNWVEKEICKEICEEVYLQAYSNFPIFFFFFFNF